MTLEIPMLLPSASNLREHWAEKARRVKSQREQVAWRIIGRERPTLPCRVRLTRVAPRFLDDDNLRGALKACRDEVARWLGVDDADPRVRWEYGQARDGRPRYQAVRIEVEA